jgi:hypothetical protein
MTTNKKYSKEFKLDAISLVVEQQYTQTEAARSLDTTRPIPFNEPLVKEDSVGSKMAHLQSMFLVTIDFFLHLLAHLRRYHRLRLPAHHHPKCQA